MDSRWFVRHDWPQEYELQRREGLLTSIRSIPGGDQLSETDLEGMAVLLYTTSTFSALEEEPRSRDASMASSEAELVKLHDLCEKLQAHISQMHRPAVEALHVEGCFIFDLQNKLGEAQEIARCAYGALQAPERVAGARPKITAEQVGLQAGLIYEHVSGKRATYSSDYETSIVSGPWPDFLAAVFGLLGVNASAGAQAKALSKKLAEIPTI